MSSVVMLAASLQKGELEGQSPSNSPSSEKLLDMVSEQNIHHNGNIALNHSLVCKHKP